MSNSIQREMSQELLISSQSYPIVTILGPRQSGKTTLAQRTFPNKTYVNLEDPDERAFALSDPRAFLARFPDGAILDEVQRAPHLLSYIQVIVDQQKQLGLFILTGSHQLELQESITQSLAGRTGMLYLYPLSLRELSACGRAYTLNEQLMYGGYPRIYDYNLQPLRFYRDYTLTYLERDLKQLIHVRDLDQFQRFLYLCAARVGCVLDYTSFANELGISRHTIKEWISILKSSFVIMMLPPYFENFGKQVIKSPKLYFTDVGLLSYLLGIQEVAQLERHPLRGKLFENLVILEVMKHFANQGKDARLFFYRDKQQQEIDLLIPQANDLFAMEIKSSQTFHHDFLKTIKKIKTLTINRQVHGVVVYAGSQEQSVEGISVIHYKNVSGIFERIDLN